MEVTVKMNAQEALATVEKGTLANLIKSAESELEEKPARPETPTPRPEPGAQAKPEPEAQQAPVKTVAPQTPAVQTPTPQPDEPARDIPQTPAPQAPAPQAPVSAVSYSADDLQKAAIGLMDMGKQPELIALLRSFGVEALPALPQDKYDAFALKLRELGARI